jgi:hypothetical protein
MSNWGRSVIQRVMWGNVVTRIKMEKKCHTACDVRKCGDTGQTGEEVSYSVGCGEMW